MFSHLAFVLFLSSPGKALPAAPSPQELLPEAAPWSQLEVADCEKKLHARGLGRKHFRFALSSYVKREPKRGPNPIFCHVPQGLFFHTGITGVKYYGYSYQTCALTLAMVRMEEIAQEEARRIFERPESENPITGIKHLGTYNCRRLRHGRTTQSQHSFGNAIDLEAFRIKGYGLITVKQHWNPRYPYWDKGAEFMRALSNRLRDEQVFTNVITPESDNYHGTHLHLDLAPTKSGLPAAALKRLVEPEDKPLR